MRSSNEIWWTGVIGASEYMECITQSLENKNSILLYVPQGIPWHDYFMERIKTVNPNRNTMSFNIIDCSKIKDDNLGIILLKKYGSMEQFNSYKSNVSIIKYLLNNDILENRTIWLYNVSERLESKWINFILELKKHTTENNIIICMEVNSVNIENVGINNSLSINIIPWKKYISNYDVLTFAMHRVRNLEEPNCIKNYISQVVSNVSCLDIEFCDALINEYYNLIRYPQQTVQGVCNKVYTNNKAEIFKMTKRQFNYIIWSCQEQVIFPIIEQQRLNFIKRYEKIVSDNYETIIEEAHDYQTIDLNTYMDLELTLLVKMCNMNLKGTTEIKNNSNHWDMLKKLRNARNCIAHRKPIDFDVFYQIINNNFFN